MIFDTDDIKTEQDFVDGLFMLTRIGGNLLQQIPSKNLRDLVLSLQIVKRHYLIARDNGKVGDDINLIVIGEDDETEGQADI
jgi:hypothetical protein